MFLITKFSFFLLFFPFSHLHLTHPIGGFLARLLKLKWLSSLAFKLQKLRNGEQQQGLLYLVIVSQTFFITSSHNCIYLSVSLQHQVLLLLMSEETAGTPQVFLFSGTKFLLNIKMVSYCITQLPITEITIVVFHKQWL